MQQLWCLFQEMQVSKWFTVFLAAKPMQKCISVKADKPRRVIYLLTGQRCRPSTPGRRTLSEGDISNQPLSAEAVAKED
jgi:hypothetical protein